MRLPFSSSPTTFATVVDPSTIEYPTEIPTATELNAKVDRELPRIQAQATSAANDAMSRPCTSAVTVCRRRAPSCAIE